jgi:CDP-diacylglycerol--glycerol-3-phosphate 3-phosphatidyltransferase/cardiolipin synthase
MGHLPNALTIGRILAIPVIVALLFWHDPAARWIAFAIYVAACLTDYLDGWLARRLRASSALGRLLDPIADKLLVGGLLIMLAATGEAPAIAVALIICRELLVSGLREYLAADKVLLPVTRLAKWKTATQMVALGLLLLGATGPVLATGVDCVTVGRLLLWVATALTLVTGWDYFHAALRRVRA